jgi:hypothetical protein
VRHQLCEIGRAAWSGAPIKLVEVDKGTHVRYFGDRGCSTKDTIAGIIADWFEELAWKLPVRKIWLK